MEHKGTVTLETPRLILRRLTLADAEPMYRNWASDSGVTKFLTWPTHSSVEVTKQILALWASHYEELNYYQWGIVVKDENALIGTIAAVKTDDEIKEVGLNRIAARHDVNNSHSGGVMKKCGMQFEGIMREGAKNNGGLCDIANYAILKKDRA